MIVETRIFCHRRKWHLASIIGWKISADKGLSRQRWPRGSIETTSEYEGVHHAMYYRLEVSAGRKSSRCEDYHIGFNCRRYPIAPIRRRSRQSRNHHLVDQAEERKTHIFFQTGLRRVVQYEAHAIRRRHQPTGGRANRRRVRISIDLDPKTRRMPSAERRQPIGESADKRSGQPENYRLIQSRLSAEERYQTASVKRRKRRS